MQFTSPGNGTLTKIRLLVNDTTPAGHVKVAIYDHNPATGLPGTLLWGGASTSVVNGWMEWTTPAVSVKANTIYWLVYWLDTGNGIRYQSEAGNHVWWFLTYGNWPSALTASVGGSNSNQYVMQAVYQPAG